MTTLTQATATPPNVSDTDRSLGDEQSSAIRSAALLLTVATLVASGFNYVINLVLARWMSPSEFGDANLIVTMMLGLTAVAISLQLIAAQRVSAASVDARSGWRLARAGLVRRSWQIGSAIGAAIVLCSPLVRDVSSSASAIPFVILAVGLPFSLVQSVERGVLQGHLRFRPLALTLVVEAVARLVVALMLVLAGFGVTGATVGITLSFVASWLCGRRSVEQLVSTSPGPTSDSLHETGHTNATRVGQATTLLLVGQIVINNGDVVLAKVLFDAEQAGVYSVVALIGRAIFFLSWSIVTAAFPHAAQADEATFRTIRKQTVRSVAIMSAVMTVGVSIAAPRLAPIVFGEEYRAAGALFAPYAIATAIFAVANAFASLGVARGRREPAVAVVIGALFQTGLLLMFVGNSTQMVWLQVAAMGAVTVGVFATGTRERTTGRVRRMYGVSRRRSPQHWCSAR